MAQMKTKITWRASEDITIGPNRGICSGVVITYQSYAIPALAKEYAEIDHPQFLNDPIMTLEVEEL